MSFLCPYGHWSNDSIVCSVCGAKMSVQTEIRPQFGRLKSPPKMALKLIAPLAADSSVFPETMRVFGHSKKPKLAEQPSA